MTTSCCPVSSWLDQLAIFTEPEPTRQQNVNAFVSLIDVNTKAKSTNVGLPYCWKGRLTQARPSVSNKVITPCDVISLFWFLAINTHRHLLLILQSTIWRECRLSNLSTRVALIYLEIMRKRPTDDVIWKQCLMILYNDLQQTATFLRNLVQGVALPPFAYFSDIFECLQDLLLTACFVLSMRLGRACLSVAVQC